MPRRAILIIFFFVVASLLGWWAGQAIKEARQTSDQSQTPEPDPAAPSFASPLENNPAEAINNGRSGNLTNVTYNTSLGGLVVDFATRTSRKWWAFWRKVRHVRNGDQKSMSANLYDTLNN